jgi:hypothetical protein
MHVFIATSYPVCCLFFLSSLLLTLSYLIGVSYYLSLNTGSAAIKPKSDNNDEAILSEHMNRNGLQGMTESRRKYEADIRI